MKQGRPHNITRKKLIKACLRLGMKNKEICRELEIIPPLVSYYKRIIKQDKKLKK